MPSKIVILIVLFLSLFFIRFWLSTFFYNPDFWNYKTWVSSINESGSLDFYEKDFSPRAQANYPPLTNILFLVSDRLYNLFFENNGSTETLASFYKLPGIILETLLAVFLIYKKQVKAALVLILNPAIAYNTLFWGQTEGAVSTFAFLSVIAFLSSYSLLGLVLFTLSLLIKQSALVFIPIITAIVVKLVSFKNLLVGVLISMFIISLLFLPFTKTNPISYAIEFFIQQSGGQEHQHLASVNAFNFWYLLGLNKQPDSITISALDFRTVGFLVASTITILIVLKLLRQKHLNKIDTLTAVGLVSFSAFLFLTRIHERHFLPVLFFLLPLAVKSLKNLLIYIFLSISHLLNLYWVWGYPEIPQLSFVFKPDVINFMIVANLIIFIYLTTQYLKPQKLWTLQL